MSGTKVTVKKNVKAMTDLYKGMDWIKKMDVLVGIPAEQNAAHKGGVTNAELLYIHNNGAPGAGIPARPVLEPGIQETSESIRPLLHEGIKKALNGDLGSANAAYQKAGMLGTSGVQGKFGVGLTALKPETVKRKGSSLPLIDTGSLRKAITYVVRENPSGKKEVVK